MSYAGVDANRTNNLKRPKQKHTFVWFLLGLLGSMIHLHGIIAFMSFWFTFVFLEVSFFFTWRKGRFSVA